MKLYTARTDMGPVSRYILRMAGDDEEIDEVTIIA